MKTALLFGSSGLIGGHLLRQLIENNDYAKIKVFVRSVPEINDPKVEIIKTDFNNLDNHKEEIKGDDCFFCIGTTRKNTPNYNWGTHVLTSNPASVILSIKSSDFACLSSSSTITCFFSMSTSTLDIPTRLTTASFIVLTQWSHVIPSTFSTSFTEPPFK